MHSRLNDEEIEFHRPFSLSLVLITWPAVSQRSLLYFLSGRNKKKNKKIVSSSSFSLLPAEASHLLLLLLPPGNVI
jgi:hypothetical protein